MKKLPVIKNESINSKRRWLWEFSKKIVVTVTIIFVVVYTFSCILLCMYPDSSALQSVIENISDVFKVTVVSYALKAGFENLTKIRKYDIYQEQEYKEDEKDEEEIYTNPRGEDG